MPIIPHYAITFPSFSPATSTNLMAGPMSALFFPLTSFFASSRALRSSALASEASSFALATAASAVASPVAASRSMDEKQVIAGRPRVFL